MKKTVLFLGVFAALFCAGQVWAADAAPAKPLTAQQIRMKTCAAQYEKQKNTAKVDYRHFMSQCLRKYPLPAKSGTQQQ
jgi:outer membrane lipoprotein-sorting protein